MAKPEFLAEGDEALKRVAALKNPTASSATVSSTLGPVQVTAGMRSWDKLRLVVYADGAGVVYLEGDKLWKMSPADFVRDEQIRAFEKAGKSAEPWVKIWKTEVDFICAVVIPWWGSIGVMALEGAMFYGQNKDSVDAALKHGRACLDALIWIRSHCPKLFDQIVKASGLAVLKEMPASLDIPVVAKFIGRMLHFLKDMKNPADKKMIAVLTLKVIAKLAVKVAAIVLSLKIPHLTANAILAASKKASKSVQSAFKEHGIPITELEAEEISRELLLRQTQIEQKTKDFERSAKELEPALEKVLKAYEDR